MTHQDKKGLIMLIALIILAIAISWGIYGKWALLVVPGIILMGTALCIVVDKWIEK